MEIEIAYFEQNGMQMLQALFHKNGTQRSVFFALDPQDETHAKMISRFEDENELAAFAKLLADDPNTAFSTYTENL
jgi:hypothetical protein